MGGQKHDERCKRDAVASDHDLRCQSFAHVVRVSTSVVVSADLAVVDEESYQCKGSQCAKGVPEVHVELSHVRKGDDPVDGRAAGQQGEQMPCHGQRDHRELKKNRVLGAKHKRWGKNLPPVIRSALGDVRHSCHKLGVKVMKEDDLRDDEMASPEHVEPKPAKEPPEQAVESSPEVVTSVHIAHVLEDGFGQLTPTEDCLSDSTC
mmetsp:Transcript_50703/g.117738  ORF Transcript_50703/g.117738 Transcript_50703/m.117738 type:complete len:206 (+) Transcript_50703:1805-2422(+)